MKKEKLSRRNLSKYKSHITDEGRVCTKCGEFKTWDHYYKSNKTTTGRQSCCMYCKKSGYTRKQDRSQERAQSKLNKERLKKINPYLWRARNVRSSLMSRAKKLGIDRSNIPKAESIEGWLRAQEPLECYYSGKPVDLFEMNIDHKVPLSRGGSNTFDNLCITCHKMNSAKGQMTDSEFKELLHTIERWEDGGKYVLMRLRQGFMGKR